ncbi:Stk1 family PASTA domain-containing Ser/Thr kinase [Fundicoccus culcitae]|uniref:non-specific serine/threonine protein kinase n=1 Tax=Fundicoccus culcitae TaxID=2969821 RepID=A0ABY5P6N1_9LACT|nr:Stk1 family PASTA domain-containing Ser/Thr kinase [Fundicoccus culcitae]UUX34083.1 Stk1 family PASTA domain-containing Ser/Thr kinase [Fundicoccus culcitae]
MEIGEKLSGRYKIIKTIGQGGMANVFLARDLILERDVAVKVLRYDFQNNQDAIRRFQREAMSASQLLHHNIVEVYDVDEENNQQYIVMEYVDGYDLKSFIKKNAPVSLELTVSIMSQILSAIEVAHKHRIIHRDIKPQNILLTKDNEVKITDFGIAIALSDTSITQTNTLLGSVHYLSPEQARGSSATTKSDIYALGVVLYELITGSVPFDGESAVSIALKHFQESFPRIRDELSYVPQSLENVVLKATAKDPKNRYNTVQEMLNDLSTSLSANRMNEPLFVPSNDLDETVVLPSIKPITKAPQALVDKVAQPEPLDESIYPNYEEATPYEEPYRRRRGIFRIIFIVLLLVGIALGGYYVYNQASRFVNVPNVSNLSIEEATSLLAENDLTVNNINRVWHNTIATGQVISSTPNSNERVRRNTTVDLTVSNGREQVEIGNYVGEDYETIRRQLTQADFIVDIRWMATTDPAEVGIILEQSIQPGSRVIPSETSITLTVGNQVDSVTMQDFYNLSLDMVYSFADAFGVYVDVTYEYSDFIPSDQVISQSPVNATPLSPGDTISVVVSQGPEEEEIIPTTEIIDIEYVPVYADNDTEMANPLPNQIVVYIGDSTNNINDVYRELEITESQRIQLRFFIPSNGTGNYRILRNGEVYAESDAVYPQ